MSSQTAGGYSWCIIIPAFNEEQTLRGVVEKTRAVLEDVANGFSILIIDDGSTDNTGQIADDLQRQDTRVQVIHHEGNKGIGVALVSGYTRADADVIGMICSDGQFDPDDLRRFAPYLQDYDIIASFRQDRRDSFYRMLLTRTDRWLVRLLFGLSMRDVNWVKLYKRWVIKRIQLESASPFLETEIVVKAKKMGANITEFPAPYYPRVAGRAKGASLFHLYRTMVDLLKLYSRLR